MKRVVIGLLLSFVITAAFAGNKPKLMWLDCSANFKRFSFPDSIRYYVDKCAETGITDLVLDIKGTTGMVLYPSKIAKQKKEWKGHSRPDFDFINTFIDAARSRNLKIYLSMNVFVDGHGIFQKGGIYNENKAWQSINYQPGKGLVPVTEIPNKATMFFNPALPEVQAYELSIIKEVVTNYDADGIMLDRTRYDCINSDFSPQSKTMFEKYAGVKVERYPEDIYEWVQNADGTYKRVDGKYFKQWIEWRASVIYGFFKKVRKEVKRIKPDYKLGTYTGAWYPSYFEVGVNWASKKYDPSKDFDWATKKYKKYGYAELLDIYTNGNYYWNVTLQEYRQSNGKHRNETDSEMSEGEHLCVEGGCKYSRKLLGNNPFYGGLYVEDYKKDPIQFERAVKMNLKESDGLMIFDIVHIINRNWWENLKQAIADGDK